MRSSRDLSTIQRKIASLIVHHKKLAIFLKPGGGKTAAALYAMRHLSFNRCLIVAPVRVCETVWRQESKEWAELTDFSFTWLAGTPTKRLQLINRKTDFHLISYDLLRWLGSNFVISKQYDAIIFDELSMLKSSGSNRFRAIRYHIDRINISIGLTGTPVGNSLLGMWSQMYSCLGSHTPLGKSDIEFKYTYFRKGGFEGREWLPRKDTFDLIMCDLKNYAFSFEIAKEYCPISFNPIQLKLPPKIKNLYDRLAAEFYIEIENRDIFALGSGPLAMKLRQIEGGAIYDSNHEYSILHNLQLEVIDDLIEELNGDSLIIVYEFKFQLELLKKRYPKLVTKINSKTQKSWNEGKIKLIAIHPKSCGHGLNLQFGGCNMVFMSVPWSVDLWQQTIGRIFRTGQKRSVSIYHFQGFEIEDDVIRRLKSHIDVELNLFKKLAS